jgi:hypothetical protein
MPSTRFYRLLFPGLALSALSLSPLWPQLTVGERLTVGQPQKVSGKRNDTVQAKIPVSVLSGYHVNSSTPTDEYLIPLSLKWTALGALEGGQVTYPKPSLEKYAFADKPLSVYTGNFELTVNFKVAPNAPAGPGAAAGKLSYQACNNRACFPPKTVNVTLPYQVN